MRIYSAYKSPVFLGEEMKKAFAALSIKIYTTFIYEKEYCFLKESSVCLHNILRNVFS